MERTLAFEDASDAHLIVRSASDPDAFGVLFDRNYDKVLAYHLRRTSCPQVAADLTAETFAQAFAARRRFVDLGAPGQAWLFKLASRQLSRYLRHEAVVTKARRRLDVSWEASQEELERVNELIDQEALRGRVAELMTALSARDAAALDLRVLQGLSFPDVASKLGCSEGAARVRVSRALRSLARGLDDDDR